MPVETLAWPPKTPDAALDYLYTIPLSAGDTVSSYTLTRVSGSVAIDSENRDGAAVTGKLSGGSSGETSVFRIRWETTGGRIDDGLITIAVSANGPLAPFQMPTSAHLIARYPAFAAVPVSTIDCWLADATRIVTADWIEADYHPALMALAGHNLALQGFGTAGGAIGDLAAMGVTGFKSASMSVNLDGASVSRRNRGGYDATPYGAEFQRYLNRDRGGPFLTSCRG